MRFAPRLGFACALIGACFPAAVVAAPTASPVAGISGAADAIARSPDGTVWLTEPDPPGRVAKIVPGGGVTEYNGGIAPNLPSDISPSGIATYGSDKAYFLMGASSNQWGSITSSGAITRFNRNFDKPTSITTGPDGLIWLTTDSTSFSTPDAIVRYDPATEAITKFTTGLTSTSQPFGITTGVDGAVWFIEGSTGRVGRATTAGDITFRSVGGTPATLGASHGTNWFATGLYLGAMDTSGHTLHLTAGQPTAIAAGADGATWGAATGGLVRLDADGAASFHTAGLDPAAEGKGLSAGADGHLWMTLDRAPYLVRVTVPPRLTAVSGAPTGPETATVGATVRPNGIATIARLELQDEGGQWTSLAETAVGDGTTAAPVSFSASGLTPDADNVLRVVAVNDAGVQSQTTTVSTPEPGDVPEPTTPDPTTPAPTTPAPTTPDPTTPAPTTPDPTTPAPTTPAPTTPEVKPTTPSVSPVATDAPAPERTTPDAVRETTPAATEEPTTALPPTEEGPVAMPMPVQGATIVGMPDRGMIRVRVPGSDTFREVTYGATIPTGSVIDATQGAIMLASRVGEKIQEGMFSGGQFRVGQVRATGMTQIKLTERLDCPASKKHKGTTTTDGASAKKSAKKKAKKKRRHVWGQDNGGRYETHGRDSVATVRGTKWLTTDTCAGTVVKVFEGAVSVQPKVGGKPTLVKAGGRHFTPRPR